MKDLELNENALNIYVWNQEEYPERANNVESFFEQLLNYAFQHVPYKLGTLELIIVAMPDELKEAIHWAQDRAGAIKGFTSEQAGDEPFHQTGAKTISRLHANGNVVSTVVINAGMLYLVSEEMKKNHASLLDWDESAQFFLYTFIHELGHVYDNYVRNNYKGNKVNIFEEGNWKLLAEHCSSVVTGEYLACYYAASAVAPELQQQMVENWYEEVSFYLSDLFRRRDDFVYNAELASIHSLWMIISQFGKLIGHRANNKDLPAFSLWDGAVEVEQEIFFSIETILLNEFPSKREDSNIDEFANEKLIPLWLRLASLYGFDFED